MPFVTRVIMSSVRKSFANRKFYELPQDYASKSSKTRSLSAVKKEDATKLIKFIDDSIIGKNTTFVGPYGRRKVVYCDWTASGRSIQFIEDYILKEVLPTYGNTHTTTTVTSMQSTLFRHEARDIIRNAVRASEEDAVIFSGSGCTGAVHKLIHALELTDSPVVFVGPCEHHSNLLPWREIGAKIVRVSETKEGFLDLVDLENQLQLHRTIEGAEKQLIGCFSAASNITGILADDIATTAVLHQYGALAFWDYATAAPYVHLDMNPILPGVNEKAVYKDAMFFSGHKFPGGVQTPGILIAKKSLFVNPVPQVCGGGTVFFVTHSNHRYLQDTELREEGGTAAIVESIRAGLVMQLKQSVGEANILSREEKISKTMVSHLKKIPEVILLGNCSQSVKRLAVFSFLVRHPRGTFLHHNFVCAVLNDVFGIQARGGCACAGPYAQDLLGIDEDLAAKYESVLLEDSRLDRHHLRRKEEHSAYEMLRPGFTRLSLPYFMNEAELAFVMEAVKMVATEGWKLLPQYILNPETGEWRHHTNTVFRDRKWLGAIRYIDGKMTVNERKVSGVSACPMDNGDCLQIARNTFNKARKMAQRYPLADQCVMFDEATNHLRWFMLPSEAQDLLLGNCCNVKTSLPFSPSGYSGSRGDCISPLDSPIQPFSRHMSLSGLENKAIEIRFHRPRSDSHSPSSRPPGLLKPAMLSPRERCYSLGGATLPKLPLRLRERQISCSSQTDGLDVGSDHDSTFGDTESRGATPPIVVTANNTEHLQAYVHELSKELATEIKSEIREVISQVEDVLCDSSDSSDTTVRCNTVIGSPSVSINSVNSQFKPISPPSSNNGDRTCTSPNNSVTADHVAEYLAELTTEMVSEMKSEIREMVSAVDELISPSGESLRTPSPESTENERNKAELGDSLTDVVENEGLNSITEGVEDCCKLKFKESRRSTVNSLSSQDSGINMIYSDKDVCTERRNKFKKQNDEKKTDKICPLAAKLEKEKDTSQESKQPPKVRWHCPPKHIWKPMMEAIKEHSMIEDGDRVMVCLSGGKDSLSLLHSLHQYQFYAKSKGINFTIGAATVDPGSTAYNPRPLIPYLEALGVHYLYEEQSILETAAQVECKSVCSFCSRMKRGRLYAAARREGYNVLALGQHLDDLAESFLMSTFHNGRLRSMKAHYAVNERDLRVIRPFVYVREHALRKFAESRCLPVIPENCPACFEAPKERHRIKQLLAKEEIQFKNLFLSLRSALKPIISFRATGEESKAYQRLTHAVDSDTEEEPLTGSSDSK